MTKITEYAKLDYTEDQLEAFNIITKVIEDFKHNPRQVELAIAGYAGTGKTTILNNIIKYAKASNVFNLCMILAPTNKAKLVVANKIDIPADSFSTLHSFLYKAPDKNEEWILSTAVTKAFIVVEEASMLSTDIKQDLLQAAHNSLILYIGDGFQLEPIGKNPKIFSNARHYLKEVKRNDGEILNLSIKIRKNNLPLIPNKSTGNIQILTYSEAYEHFVNKLKNKEDIIFIVSTNKLRMKVNNNSRSRIFQNKDSILKGEKLISVCNSAYFSNGETYTIEDNIKILFDEMVSFYNKFSSHYYMRVVIFRLKGKINILLPDLDKSSFYHYNMMDADLGVLQRLVGSENIEYNKEGYANLSKNVNIFTYGYAITAHKSQGSQFKEVVVYFNWCHNDWNKARWFYTAITRAEEKLVLIPTKETEYE